MSLENNDIYDYSKYRAKLIFMLSKMTGKFTERKNRTFPAAYTEISCYGRQKEAYRNRYF